MKKKNAAHSGKFPMPGFELGPWRRERKILTTRPHGTFGRTFDVDNRTRLQSLLKLCNRRTGKNVKLDVVKNYDVQ